MRVLLGHPAGFVVVAAALAGCAAVFATARPQYRERVLSPPDHGLAYTEARWSAADARRAFAAAGVALGPRSRSHAVTTLGSAGDVLEVDVFADRATVEASGFSDYVFVPPGRYVRFPRSCGSSVPDAERWRGNVRAVVSCSRAGGGADVWLRRVERALAAL